MQTNAINIFQLGYNRDLQKDDEFYNPPSIMESNMNSTNPIIIGSGGIASNLTMNQGFMQSSNFVSLSAGWKIEYDGNAQFNNLTLIGGTVKYAKTSFTDSTHAGYYFGSEGIYFGSALDATKLKYSIAAGTFDFIGTISGRSSATLALAIDSAGHFIDAVLNTSAKTILSDFNFGAVDYAGAVKSGTIAWNTTTGAITGGSGVVVYRGGIIGANAGVPTFTLESATGNATFAGTLSAAAGTLGSITAGTLTGCLFRTATSGARMEIRSDTTRLNAFNASGQVAELNYGETAGVGILKLTPIGTAARCIEIIIPSGLGSDAQGITIANSSTSYSLDIAGGTTGIDISGCSDYAIQITHSGTYSALTIGGGAASCINLTPSTAEGITIAQSGTNAGSHGISVTQGAAAIGHGLVIDNDANSHVSHAMLIDRLGDADDQLVSAVIIKSANQGTGGRACGIDFTDATIQGIMNVAVDTTAVGAATGRIPIYVGGTLRYLAYYAA